MPKNVNNEFQEIHTNKISSKAGGLTFDTIREGNTDLSHVTLYDNNYSFLSFKGGMAYLRALSDISLDIGGDHHLSIKGISQTIHGSDSHILHKGEHTETGGDTAPKALAAAQSIKKIHNEIQKEMIDSFEKTKGSKVKCRICNKKILTQKADELAGKIAATVDKYLWPPYIPHCLDKLQKVLSTLVVPFISLTSNQTVTGKSTCGNPSCKDGLIEVDDLKYQEANKTQEELLKKRNDEINEHQKVIKPHSHVNVIHGDDAKYVGVPDAESIKHPTVYAKGNSNQNPQRAVAGTSGYGHGYGSAAIADPMKIIGSPFPCVGHDELHAGYKITRTAGMGGFDLKTDSHFMLNAGDIEITAHHAGLSLSTPALLQLSGPNIHIDAKNHKGKNHGVEITSDSTHIAGGLSIAGNLHVKGAIVSDATVNSPHFEGRSMMGTTTVSDPCLFNSTSDVWNTIIPIPNGNQATVIDAKGIALRTFVQAINLLDIDSLLSTIWNWIQTAIHGAKLKVPLANLGTPVGFAVVYDLMNKTEVWAKVSPEFVFDAQGVGQYAEAGVWGMAQCLPQIIPVWVGPHVHGPSISGTHSHNFEMMTGTHHKTMTGLHSVAPNPSHIPDAPREGMLPGPGPKGLAGGSCGGGGAGFGNPNSRASQAQLARNQAYGINGQDAYGGLDYVPIVPKYNKDGTLNPDPTFSMEYLCE
jgi:hypothetical protein